MNPSEARLEGGCYCGAVRYRARRALDAGYCHCSVCRRFTGSSSLPWFLVRRDELHIDGHPRGFASSPGFVRHFCGECGVHVFGSQGADLHTLPAEAPVCIAIGNLDAPERVVPSVHQWWSSRVPWFEQASGLPRFDGGSISPPAGRFPVSPGDPSLSHSHSTPRHPDAAPRSPA